MRGLLYAIAWFGITGAAAHAETKIDLICAPVALDAAQVSKDPIVSIRVVKMDRAWSIVHSSLGGLKYFRGLQYYILDNTHDELLPSWEGTLRNAPNIEMVGAIYWADGAFHYSETLFDDNRGHALVARFSSICAIWQPIRPDSIHALSTPAAPPEVTTSKIPCPGPTPVADSAPPPNIAATETLSPSPSPTPSSPKIEPSSKVTEMAEDDISVPPMTASELNELCTKDKIGCYKILRHIFNWNIKFGEVSGQKLLCPSKNPDDKELLSLFSFEYVLNDGRSDNLQATLVAGAGFQLGMACN